MPSKVAKRIAVAKVIHAKAAMQYGVAAFYERRFRRSQTAATTKSKFMFIRVPSWLNSRP
jgi:hypothetical protein